MKTTNNYEAPVAEMIEMTMPVVLADTVPNSGGQNSGNQGSGPGIFS